MLDHQALKAWLESASGLPVDDRQDRKNSVSSKVMRGVYEGRLAVAVGADSGARAQIPALVDLLDLHLHAASKNVSADEVALILGGCPSGPEVLDALGTLVSSKLHGPQVTILTVSDDGTASEVPSHSCDFTTAAEYGRWPGLLRGVEAGPPELLRELVGLVDNEALRAYQMLSGNGSWSLRLDGLQVGLFKGDEGVLNVGRPGKTGNVSQQRKVWLDTTRTNGPVRVAADPDSLRHAAAALTTFADAWLPALTPGGSAPMKQDEHALEARVLRGNARVDVDQVGTLSPLRPDDKAVNWGSQFPTKWGREGSARYLDALMRVGRTPWAVEIKIMGGTGAGGYYRHAVHQAVLYRHFICQAAPLQPWFDLYDLDREACEAAVLVPEMTGPWSRWRDRLLAVAGLFDLPVVEIDHKYAGIH